MKYKCTICGYVYDDAKEDIPFAQLPDTWQCPLCGAPKSAFEPLDTPQPSVETERAPSKTDLRAVQTEPAASPSDIPAVQTEHAPSLPTSDLHKLSIGQLASLCSNLARGCEKQYIPREQALFTELADWFTAHTPETDDPTVDAIADRLKQDLTNYQSLSITARDNSDRGAQRVCVWGDKVTRMLSVLVERYRKEGDAMLQDNEIWVCSVCGFVYIGKSAPELCPVCKVPAWKFNKIDRRN